MNFAQSSRLVLVTAQSLLAAELPYRCPGRRPQLKMYLARQLLVLDTPGGNGRRSNGGSGGVMVDHGTRAIDKPSDPPSGVFRRPSTDDARWVVVEAGAQFGRVSGDLGTEHTVVLPQWRGESMTGMASRVVERLDAERRAGHDTQRLVLVVSGHAPERLSGRSAIARSLLRHLLDVGGGELELRPDACAEACRHDLLALVERLLPSLRGSPVSVRVAFPDSRRGPGATSRRHGRSALRGRRDLAVSA